MSSDPASIQSLKNLIKQRPSSDELHDMLLRLTEDFHDRGAALSAVSLLDGYLQHSLSKKLRPDNKPDYLFGSGAPLRSLSAKIRLGYALGLFDSRRT